MCKDKPSHSLSENKPESFFSVSPSSFSHYLFINVLDGYPANIDTCTCITYE